MDGQKELELIRALARGYGLKELVEREDVTVQQVIELRQTWTRELEEAGAEQRQRERSTAGYLPGIDISTWQGAPDFQRVKGAGVQFVIARAGYGSNHIDRQFRRTASECNRLNLPLGAYWFCYALNADQARQEARNCLEIVKPYRLEYPIFFDLEYDSIRYAEQNGVTITRELATQMVIAFCEEVERAGYYAANYTNSDLARNLFDMAALSRFDLWYAWYHTTLNREGVGVWQYSSSGQVDGISGNVDLDYSLKDYPRIIREKGLNGLDDPAGYPAGTPAWQIEGFEALIEQGIINTPEYWRPKFDQPMTVGEAMGILGKM